jgi:hypothetical protein
MLAASIERAIVARDDDCERRFARRRRSRLPAKYLALSIRPEDHGNHEPKKRTRFKHGRWKKRTRVFGGWRYQKCFAPAAVGDHATPATGHRLRLTRTGLSPAGPRQLTWRTSNPVFLCGFLDCFAALAMTLRGQRKPHPSLLGALATRAFPDKTDHILS